MSEQAYLQLFVEESREHLQQMNALLLQLEGDPDNVDLLKELFRSAHTLKGMSATMGFEDMAELTHELENVMQQLRDGETALTDAIMDVLFQVVDRLERMVEQAANGEPMEAIDDVLEKLLGKASQPDRPSEHPDLPGDRLVLDEYEQNILEISEKRGYQPYVVNVTLREDCKLKAARAYMVYEALEEKGEVIKSLPPIEDLEEERFDRSFRFVVVSKDDAPTLQQLVENISEVENVHVVKLVEAMWTKSLAKKEEKPTKKGQGSKKRVQQRSSKMIRVDIERLDTLMNLFSEWVIDRGRLEQIARELNHQTLSDIVEHMSRVSGDLQNTILNMRMVSIDQVFNRFPRMVRDLAKEMNKQVQLDISGEETELDRTVVDEIGDPLVHLLRNALDHGLETAEERKRRGKLEVGRIALRAFHSGNHVFIEIEDDGAGIDRDKVLNKAVERGIVESSERDNMTDGDVYKLLFDSGFSTADQITDVSGRGVGLDVVRNKIESLGGSVTVDSEKGKGTKFSIQLPMTLSILTALLVRVQQEKFAIPLSAILETGKFKRDDVKKVHGQPVLRFRERVVPLLSLQHVFSVPAATENKPDDLFVVIVKKREQLTGIIVDEFLGQQEVVLKSLGNYLTQVFAISGATILGDGQVALIVDTNALVK